MRNYRAKPTDPELAGKDGFVYGWYVKVGPKNNESHYILPDPIWISSKITGLDEDCLIGLVLVIPETVGQSIGLCDKNGKEGYAGDLVDPFFDCGSRGDHILKIVWCEKTAGFKFEGLHHETTVFLLPDLIKYEIIGNVFENKDLLNDSKKTKTD